MSTTKAIPDFKPVLKNGVTLPSSLKQAKGGLLTAVTLNDIPLTAKGYGDKAQTSLNMLIVEVERAGFSRVPQEERKGKYIVPDSAQYLTELCDETDASGNVTQVLQCYAFQTIEGCPKDKGERKDDVTHRLQPGMIIRQSFFADRARGGEKYDKKMVPLDDRDVLPAFTVVSIEWNVKGWTKWMEGEINPINNKPMKACAPSCGYGGTVTSISAIPGVSAYSIIDRLIKWAPKTVPECQQKQRAFLAKNRTIENMLVQQNACCYVDEISAEAHIAFNSDKQLVKVYNWCSSVALPIDIDLEAALRYTNSSTLDECCKIMELHLLTGSLSALVYYNEYRVKPGDEGTTSPYFGVPLLRVEKMFKALTANPLPLDESSKFAFATPEWRLPDENDKMVESQLQISVEVLPDGDLASKIGCADLCITSCDPDCIRKGYGVAIVRGEATCWKGRCVEIGGNTSFAQKAENGAAEIRKRWIAGSILGKPEALQPASTKKSRKD